MISQNPYSNCMSARLYFYDFLHEETKTDIPESTLSHITDCPDCQAEIHRLDALLSNAKNIHDNRKNSRNTAITSLLKFHFSYVNESVTCSIVKPFLASLADPFLRLTIPTPITEHIVKCRQCRDDLHTLEDLHLTHKQLCRLGQILAQMPTEDTVSCSDARKAIPDVASMVFGRTNAETLKHLSTCPECRERLFRYREEWLLESSESGIDPVDIPCKAISSSDIFDYALPYGIDPSDDEYAEFREPFASHLGGCPTCMSKVQELLQTIYKITERSESGVVTVYHVDEPVTAETESQQSKTINFTERLRQTASSPRVRLWLKASVAAAAVLVIGLSVMLNEPTVEADSWDQISTAIKNARNLHISTYYYSANGEQLIEEKWFSRFFGLYMYRDKKRCDLLDFPNKLQIIRNLDNNSVEKSDLPNNELQTEIEKNTAMYLNLLPFARLSDAPKGTTWERAKGNDKKITDENSTVTDLVFTETSLRDSQRTYKRKFYIDPKKSIPYKIEIYNKTSKNEDYTLENKIIVEQISDSQMQDAIDNAFH
ncbi:MAG: hypothetical protein JXM79_14225 [Sedimentisphaerales bacterium]|nr:hypothetical protein [Sedimentisphaerales bacterium]